MLILDSPNISLNLKGLTQIQLKIDDFMPPEFFRKRIENEKFILSKESKQICF